MAVFKGNGSDPCYYVWPGVIPHSIDAGENQTLCEQKLSASRFPVVIEGHNERAVPLPAGYCTVH